LLKFRREAAELEARLNALKDRLPGEKEIPTLYRTLSDAATASGLAVSLFQPRPPVVRDYYSEIPISLNAEAGYHQIGEFLQPVARWPWPPTPRSRNTSRKGAAIPSRPSRYARVRAG